MPISEKVTPNPIPLVDIPSFVNNGPPAPLNDDGMSVTATLLVDSRCQLGECILYDDRTNIIVFTSILDNTFHRLNLNENTSNNNNTSHQLETYHLPKRLCALALLETPVSNDNNDNNNNNNNDEYLVAWEDGFQLYNLITNSPLSEMSVGECVNPLGLPDRLNDGRCDPTGTRFICGGCVGNSAPLKVYKCEYDKQQKILHHTPIIDEIYTTNSICWSLNGQIMYLSDSPTLQIHQYDYDCTTGEISNKRFFHSKLKGFADGSVVDAQGYVWNATWRQGEGTGMVNRIDPITGEIVFQVHLPDTTSEASCCCFGGPNLDILFITTAWEHLDPTTEIHAGGLYAVKLPLGMTGLKEQRFKLLE